MDSQTIEELAAKRMADGVLSTETVGDQFGKIDKKAGPWIARGATWLILSLLLATFPYVMVVIDNGVSRLFPGAKTPLLDYSSVRFMCYCGGAMWAAASLWALYQRDRVRREWGLK